MTDLLREEIEMFEMPGNRKYLRGFINELLEAAAKRNIPFNPYDCLSLYDFAPVSKCGSADGIMEEYEKYCVKAEAREKMMEKKRKIKGIAKSVIHSWIDTALAGTPYSYYTRDMATMVALIVTPAKHKDKTINIRVSYRNFQDIMPRILDEIKKREEDLEND